MIEVIEDANFDESIWLMVPRERGAKYNFLGNIYLPPESKSIKEIANVGERAADLQTYKRQGEVVIAGDFNLRIGKASNPSENIGRYGEVTNNIYGAEMLEFL